MNGLEVIKMPEESTDLPENSGLVTSHSAGLLRQQGRFSPALSEIISRSLVQIQSDKRFSASVPRPGTEREIEIAPGVKIVMCWIPPGEFRMGSPEDEDGRTNNEVQHLVKISQGFWLAKTQTTQAQWQAIMGNNPSRFKGGDLPVDRVKWNDICGEVKRSGGFLQAINRFCDSEEYFHLPTEAQWEYACRAGTNGPYYSNLNEIAWYSENSAYRTHPVGQKKPNAWGLHDMLGNVLEWCTDRYGDYTSAVFTDAVTDPTGPLVGENRVIRGSGWGNGPQSCRVAARSYSSPASTNGDIGFRLALSLITNITNSQSINFNNFTENAVRTITSNLKKQAEAGRRAGDEMEFKIAPNTKIVMCWIPPGSFLMGGPEGGGDRICYKALWGDSQETPPYWDVSEEKPHMVEVLHGFWLGKYQITQSQWKAVMMNNPSHTEGDNLPVTLVSWVDICGHDSKSNCFMKKINKHAPNNGYFSLPTETQWEYACRAGTTGSYAGVLKDMAWYDDKLDGSACVQPVGLKMPNAWGLHDMHGNVWEWCADWFKNEEEFDFFDPSKPAPDSLRVLRGGCASDLSHACRSQSRRFSYPSIEEAELGFRIAFIENGSDV